MASRNSRRASKVEPLHTPEPDSTPAEAQQIVQHTTSTELVELPSGGLFYPKDHPLHKKDTVEIRFMTARDEDILTSPSLLRKGLAVDRFVENIIVTPGVKADDLLIGDKSALMIAARITGYGPDYDASVTCPDCTSDFDQTFVLEDYERYFIESGHKDTDFVLKDNGNFTIELPMSKRTVEVRLLTSRDEKKIQKAQAMKSKNNLQDSVTTDFLKSIIVSIDGDSNQSKVAQEVLNLPARDSRFLRNEYRSLVPTVEVNETVECPYCGSESEMEVPLEANFFWPDL